MARVELSFILLIQRGLILVFCVDGGIVVITVDDAFTRFAYPKVA